jgi:1,4-dihydroxy-6-naphthoate synthase
MTTATENKVLRIGHTPDPDDAYMFYGFASGQVKIQGFEIEHILEDIETLNQKAIHNEIEVTAISAAVYPYIHQNYWILPTGASVGRNYGPIVVKKIGNQSPKTKRIGIPGKNTTAFMLLSFYFPGYEPILYRFDQIPEAIQKGEVDFGLLIHEAQLTFKDYGLEKLMDLGVEFERYGAVLPHSGRREKSC